MQHNPKGSIVEAIDNFTYVRNTIPILELCLEQMADKPTDLIPRLHYLINAVKADLENSSNEGLFHIRVIRDFLYEHFPDKDDRLESSQLSEE